MHMGVWGSQPISSQVWSSVSHWSRSLFPATLIVSAAVRRPRPHSRKSWNRSAEVSFSNAAVPSGAPQNKRVHALLLLLQVTAAPHTIEGPLRRKHNTDPREGRGAAPNQTGTVAGWGGFRDHDFQRAIVKKRESSMATWMNGFESSVTHNVW